MNWASWSDFWAMGGRGFYVWGAYGVTLAAMLIEPWLVSRRLANARGDAAHAQAEDDA
jgi:heme exporter protein D